MDMNRITKLTDLSNWKTKREIISELISNGVLLDERSWRNLVKESNKNFYEHEIDYFVAHSNKVYKVTKDKEEIKKSCDDKKKRSINQLYEVSKVLKALGENCNLRLEITNDSFVFTEGFENE